MEVVDVDSERDVVELSPQDEVSQLRKHVPQHPPPDPPADAGTHLDIPGAGTGKGKDISSTSLNTAHSTAHTSPNIEHKRSFDPDAMFNSQELDGPPGPHAPLPPDEHPVAVEIDITDNNGQSMGVLVDPSKVKSERPEGDNPGVMVYPADSNYKARRESRSRRTSVYSTDAMTEFTEDGVYSSVSTLHLHKGTSRNGVLRGLPTLLLCLGIIACVAAKGGVEEDWSRMAVLCAACVQAVYIVAVHMLSKRSVKEDLGYVAREKELKLNERLLHSILPKEICLRVHRGDRCIEKHGSLTFCFADLVAFTKMAAKLSPTTLVMNLDRVFRLFDDLAIVHGVTKVKTIGDCYMAVTGFYNPEKDHIKSMVDWCIDVRVQSQSVISNEVIGSKGLNTRYGIATGPAVSGVLGSIRPVHDFWGDTVNMASRMESNSRQNRINCTLEVKRHLKAKYRLEFDEMTDVFVKGKGRMTTYLVKTDSPFDADPAGSQHMQNQNRLGAPAVMQRHNSVLGDLETMQSKEAFLVNLKDVIEAVTGLCSFTKLEESMNRVVELVKHFSRCDRATLFMVDAEHEELWSYVGSSNTIRIPNTTGVAGWVYKQGRSVVIHDAYDDDRFNQKVDTLTGYKTTSMMCCPVKDGKGETLAVVQAINKFEGTFNSYDEAVLNLLCGQVGVHLLYGQLGEKFRGLSTRAKLFKKVISETASCVDLVQIFLTTSVRGKQLAGCRKCALYVLEKSNGGDDALAQLYTIKGEPAYPCPVTFDSVPYGVLLSGKAVHVREEVVVDEDTGTRTVTRAGLPDGAVMPKCANMLCVPVFSAETADKPAQVIGVLEFLDRVLTASSLAAGFSEEDQVAIDSYANVIAQSLQHIDLRREVRQQGLCSALTLALKEGSRVSLDAAAISALVTSHCPNIFSCNDARLWVCENANTLRSGDTVLPLGGLTGSVFDKDSESNDGVFLNKTGLAPSGYHGFSEAIDRSARTRDCYGESVMVLAIMRGDRRCGVLQLLNKQDADAFDGADEVIAREIVKHVTSYWPEL
eukprot:TRINITY_DN1139_c0_g1_i1.p1 TRINITY_DN1139_c0_g1~~TRINITY_DN1139_c0_g1_i1.p1  ORF type:complete len:1033 (+),score=321.73 TRINITY_DN1139_c0_g1_i1:149-3247(+)